MSKRRPLIGLSLFLVVSVVLTWMVHTTLQRGVPGPTDTYSATFTDVSGLRVGDDVRMAGVQVGRVEAVEIEGTHAVVTFDVAGEHSIYGNTVVSVTYQNVIGQRYLGLSLADFGDPGVLEPGSRIPVDHTEPSFDLSGLLNGFQPLFGLLDPQDVDNLTGALIRALQGENGAIPALIAETARLAEAFAGPDEVLGSVIDNLGTVVTELARQSSGLGTTITQARRIFDGLSARRDTLFAQTEQIAVVLDRAAQVVQGAALSLDRFIDRQPGFARHFIENKEQFAYLGFNLPLLLKSLARITDHGAYLNAYVCDIGFGILPGVDPLVDQILALASPGGQTEHSAMCR
ncbi:MlaD family protein [Nocardia sp. NPDC024068]|uniref:MlaD family protein n=1 Tax=Nocardia sp. NPDC024068 TaxID=3157197 RepID=UPI0033E330D9